MTKKVFLIFLLSLLFVPTIVSAKTDTGFDNEGRGKIWQYISGGDSAGGGLEGVGRDAYGITDSDQVPSLPTTVARIIKIFLSLLGIIFLVIIVYAGAKWMMSGGNEESIGDAKKLIKNSIIGLAIIVCSYAITVFISAVLLKASS